MVSNRACPTNQQHALGRQVYTRTCGLHGQNKAHNLFYIIAVAHLSSAVGRPHCNTPTIDASTHSHVVCFHKKKHHSTIPLLLLVLYKDGGRSQVSFEKVV